MDGRELEQIERDLEAQSRKLKPFYYTGPVFEFRDEWKVQKFEYEAGLAQLQHVRDGGRGSAPGTHYRLIRRNHDLKARYPWTLTMSDTDAEIMDFLQDLVTVRGRVLVAGLGMGLVVKAMLMSDDVHKIDVVEINKDLVDSPLGRYVARSDKRVKIHLGDIYDFPRVQDPPERGTKYDWVWADVWDTYSPDNVEEAARIKAAVRRWMAPGAKFEWWCERECKYMKKHDDNPFIHDLRHMRL